MSLLVEIMEENSYDNQLDKFDVNPDLSNLSEYELLSYIGSSIIFIKDNFDECLEIFGPKVVSELIEETNKEFKQVLDENISSGVPDPKPFVDIKAIWGVIDKQKSNIAVAALIGVVAVGAYKAYKNYFSAAAKACKGKTGDEKTACMTNYEEKALSIQANVLKKSLSVATKTNDPKTFYNRVQARLKVVQQKIKNLKR